MWVKTRKKQLTEYGATDGYNVNSKFITTEFAHRTDSILSCPVGKSFIWVFFFSCEKVCDSHTSESLGKYEKFRKTFHSTTQNHKNILSLRQNSNGSAHKQNKCVLENTQQKQKNYYSEWIGRFFTLHFAIPMSDHLLNYLC